jgi:hypothetical protein
MIWVIGDIHGMFDPLKRIMTEIRLIEDETGEAVERLVFIGDYVDHGPSSKEVLDLVRRPPWPAVALMGNHEDMAVRTCRPDPDFLAEFGDMWILNGAAETCLSLVDRPGPDFSALAERLSRPSLWLPADASPGGIAIPDKYYRFLRGLRYSHLETVDAGGRPVDFVFMHALPNPAMSVRSQLIPNHAAFNRHLAALRLAMSPGVPPDHLEPLGAFLDHSMIWCRSYDFDRGYGGAVIVHGHTPTFYYQKIYGQSPGPASGDVWDQFSLFPVQSSAPFLFSRSPGARLAKTEPPDPPPPALSPGRGGRGWFERGGHFSYQTLGDRKSVV